MSYDERLRQLITLPLGGDHETDLLVEGAALDAVDAEITALGAELFPDTTDRLIAEWERIYQIVPPTGATLASRRLALIGKYQEIGDIKRPYFVALAAAMGYTIRIDDYTEAQAGWLCAGDDLYEEPWVYLSAGVGLAGDTLASEDVILPWIWEVVVIAVPEILPSPTLEAVLTDLRPPHYQLNFTYLEV